MSTFRVTDVFSGDEHTFIAVDRSQAERFLLYHYKVERHARQKPYLSRLAVCKDVLRVYGDDPYYAEMCQYIDGVKRELEKALAA